MIQSGKQLSFSVGMVFASDVAKQHDLSWWRQDDGEMTTLGVLGFFLPGQLESGTIFGHLNEDYDEFWCCGNLKYAKSRLLVIKDVLPQQQQLLNNNIFTDSKS